MATGQQIADEARADMVDNDASNLRWDDAQMINHINAAARSIVTQKPAANIVEEVVTIDNGESRQTLPAGGIKFLRAWNAGSAQTAIVVAVGNTASGTDMIMSSVDGINWTQRDHVSGGPWNFNSIGISPTVITIGADDNTDAGTYYSTDGAVTWTQGAVVGAAPPDRMRFEEIIYVTAWSRFIGVGTSTDLGNADAAYSNDGQTWNLIGIQSFNTLQCVAYSPTLDYALAIDEGGNVFWTTDGAGLAWADTTWNHPEASSAVSVVWSESLGLFCTLHANGDVWTSPTGQTWTARASLGVTYAAELEWSESQGVAVIIGNAGVQTSTDFITWTPRTISSNTWVSVTYSDLLGLWIAVNVAGTPAESATSPDAITWTDRAVEFNESWTEVKAGSQGSSVRGTALTIVERDAMNSAFPEWLYRSAHPTHLDFPDMEDEHTTTFYEHYAHDPRNPKEYYVFPATASNANIYLQYSQIPSVITDLANTFPLDDEYLDAAVSYVKFRMIESDGGGQGGDRASDAYNDFLRALGMKIQADRRVDPIEHRPPGDNLG